jgi:hypothetical protein
MRDTTPIDYQGADMKKTKTTAVILVGCVEALLCGAFLGYAQMDAPPGNVVFFGMSRGEHVVKGAPLSAQAVSETAQVLADGTHIDRKTTGMVYRDSQGRMRREETLPAFGPFAAAGKARQVVLIHDPVAGVHYLLEPDQKIARKMPMPAPEMAISDAMPPKQPRRDNSANETTESLGTQVIDGVSAVGTRTTRTIPVGQIGNDKPLEIVMERWYSTDLQMNVLTKRTDPRMGTTTYQLTNISREEPASALFSVPADYTVKEGGPRPPWPGRRREP